MLFFTKLELSGTHSELELDEVYEAISTILLLLWLSMPEVLLYMPESVRGLWKSCSFFFTLVMRYRDVSMCFIYQNTNAKRCRT